jgi:DNA-binding transcriptional MerR regulator
MTDKMSLTETAAHYGRTVETITRWARLGLIPAPVIDPAGRKYYTPDMLPKARKRTRITVPAGDS